MASSSSAASALPDDIRPIDASLDFNARPIALDGLRMMEIQEAYDDALAAVRATPLEAGKEKETRDGWTFSSHTDGVDIYIKKQAESDLLCCKGVGIVDAPVQIVSTLFMSPQWTKKWDEMYASGEALETHDPFTRTTYNSFTAPWPVSGRDFVTIERSLLLPPSSTSSGAASASHDGIGAIFTFSKSITHSQCPDKQGLVRGNCHFFSLWVEALPGQPNKSRIIYSILSDPRGSVPHMVVNSTAIKQPLCISAIRNLLAKDAQVRAEVQKKVEEFKIAAKEKSQTSDYTAPPSRPEQFTAFIKAQKQEQ